nr:proline-rich receptor-like protein kinase PERK9 [Aegilops tauschii subsp. strangulata]
MTDADIDLRFGARCSGDEAPPQRWRRQPMVASSCEAAVKRLKLLAPTDPSVPAWRSARGQPLTPVTSTPARPLVSPRPPQWSPEHCRQSPTPSRPDPAASPPWRSPANHPVPPVAMALPRAAAAPGLAAGRPPHHRPASSSPDPADAAPNPPPPDLPTALLAPERRLQVAPSPPNAATPLAGRP